MKTWMKYFIIGWSIACVGIFIVSFQMLKSESLVERHTVTLIPESPESAQGDDWETVGKYLFGSDLVEKKMDPFSFHEPSITQREFVYKMKKAKGVIIESKTRVMGKILYVVFAIYAFAIWAIPITAFMILGLIFSMQGTPLRREEPEK
jgi:hypothetical protein